MKNGKMIHLSKTMKYRKLEEEKEIEKERGRKVGKSYLYIVNCNSGVKKKNRLHLKFEM